MKTEKEEIEKWAHKWLQKTLTARAYAELREIQKEKIQNAQRRRLKMNLLGNFVTRRLDILI